MRNVCSIEGCGRLVAGRGWCKMHWKRWRTHGDPLAVLQNGVDFNSRTLGQCVADACDKPAHARQLCATHYSRWKKHGDPNHVEPILGRPWKGDRTPVAFSTDLDRYVPRCIPCHRAYDAHLRALSARKAAL